VAVHANGYQVESYLPGGMRVAFSGTSMAAPNVTNLAAKLIAAKPSLKPVQVIAIIKETAEPSVDGRRRLAHPAHAMTKVTGGT
jgi:subtilisin family serine protease